MATTRKTWRPTDQKSVNHQERRALTARTLDNLREGQKLTDGGFDPDGELRGALKGALIAKRRAGREMVEFYLRMRAEGMDRAVKIGNYAPRAGGLGLAEARALALKEALKYACEGAGYKDARKHEEDKRVAAEVAEQVKREVEESDKRGDGSLGTLLLAYVEDMRSRGRTSADDTEKMLQRHIEDRHPALWAKPARKVTREDVHEILGAMLNKGITRRVNLMRSVIGSAFQYGITLADDSKHFQLAKVFGLMSNPAMTIKRRGELERKGQRVLSTVEVGHYLRAVDQIPSLPMRVFLTAQIGLAGQRIEQLLRAKWVDFQDGLLWLVDGKGRGDPRTHIVPVPAWVAEQIERLRGLSDEWLFSIRGKKPIHPDSVTHAVGRISKKLLESGVVGASFSASDIRRTAETQLAALRVSKDIRTELLSHGRNSLIAGRYDHHQYLEEKREALDLWRNSLREWKKAQL